MPKLLFATQGVFYPDLAGGAEHSTLTLFRALRRLGWKIKILCALPLSSSHLKSLLADSWRAEYLLSHRPALVLCDRVSGFDCYRMRTSPQGGLDVLRRRLHEFRPDLVMGQLRAALPFLQEAHRLGFPSLYVVRTLGDLEPGFRFPAGIHLMANSPFMASSVRPMASGRRIPVVLPMVEPGRYRVHRRQRRFITVINPIPEKGGVEAFEICRRLPDQQFLFVEGGWGSPPGYPTLLARLRRLRNARVWSYQTDMRRVYAVTDTLLVPSCVPDSFPRVILEAHQSGIPVVASKIGGIPYALGSGGILVKDTRSPDPYVRALQRLRRDRTYARYSEGARKNACRREFDPGRQADRFIRAVKSFLPRRVDAVTASDRFPAGDGTVPENFHEWAAARL